MCAIMRKRSELLSMKRLERQKAKRKRRKARFVIKWIREEKTNGSNWRSERDEGENKVTGKGRIRRERDEV
jgi:hypothetical protein